MALLSRNKTKRTIYTSLAIVFLLLLGGRFLLTHTLKNGGKNLQEVLANLPNESVMGILNMIFNENEKQQDELLNKLNRLQKENMEKQMELLKQIQAKQDYIIDQLQIMKKPADDLSLRDKLSFLFPYDPKLKFPAYIWQSWKHGLNDERFDEKYRQGETQWAWKNPGFVHELFNDDTSSTIIRHLYNKIPEIVAAYDALPELILKMDFFRYLILYAKGGVYADIDTHPLQPVPNWIPDNVSPNEIGMIIAIESEMDTADWKEENHRRLQFGQFVIQAKPGHPILREVIAQITTNTLTSKRELESNDEKLELLGSPAQKSLTILKWTGAGIWTDVVMRYFNDYLQSSIFQKVTWKDFYGMSIPRLVSDVLILPKASFASEIEIPKDGKISDPLAFVKHHAAKIWKSN